MTHAEVLTLVRLVEKWAANKADGYYSFNPTDMRFVEKVKRKALKLQNIIINEMNRIE